MEALSYYFKEEIVIKTRPVRCCLERASGDGFLMKDLQLAQPMCVEELMFLKCVKCLKTICSPKSLKHSPNYFISLIYFTFSFFILKTLTQLQHS